MPIHTRTLDESVQRKLALLPCTLYVPCCKLPIPGLLSHKFQTCLSCLETIVACEFTKWDMSIAWLAVALGPTNQLLVSVILYICYWVLEFYMEAIEFRVQFFGVNNDIRLPSNMSWTRVKISWLSTALQIHRQGASEAIMNVKSIMYLLHIRCRINPEIAVQPSITHTCRPLNA